MGTPSPGSAGGARSRGRKIARRHRLFYSLLDEQQRRLYADLESIQHGHGGDQKMAQDLGLDMETVTRGRRELLAGEVPTGPSASEGCGVAGGRKKTPDILKRLVSLLQEDTGGPDGPAQNVDRQTVATDYHRVGLTGYYRLSPYRAPALGYVGLCLAFQ